MMDIPTLQGSRSTGSERKSCSSMICGSILYNHYAKDGIITPGEVDGIFLRLRNISGTVYEANKAIHKLMCDGFILNRENRTQKDLYAVSSAFPTALCLSMSFPSGI